MRVERGCAPVGVLVKLVCAGNCELVGRKIVLNTRLIVSANFAGEGAGRVATGSARKCLAGLHCIGSVKPILKGTPFSFSIY